MLHCKRQNAAMQTTALWLVSGIRTLSPGLMRRSAAPLKGDDNVQDCFRRLRGLHHPVRPPDGLHRPCADDLGPCRAAQWGPSLFRPLRPVNARFPELSFFCALQDRGLILSTNGPGFRGHFLCPCTDRIDIGTTSATYCTGRHPRPLNRLRSGISHTNMLNRQRAPF